MHRIKNVLTKLVFKKSLGDQGTWLPLFVRLPNGHPPSFPSGTTFSRAISALPRYVRSAVTYIYTLPRPAVAEHLAHPIA